MKEHAKLPPRRAVLAWGELLRPGSDLIPLVPLTLEDSELTSSIWWHGPTSGK